MADKPMGQVLPLKPRLRTDAPSATVDVSDAQAAGSPVPGPMPPEAAPAAPPLQREDLNKYYKDLLKRALRYTGNPDQAVDLVQDSLERALRVLPSTNVRSPRAYLYTVLERTFLGSLRKKRPGMVSIDSVDLPHQPPEPPPRYLDVTPEQLMAAVASLDEDYRIVFQLAVFEKKKHREVAGLLQISEGAVAVRLFRARRTLRGLLFGETLHDDGAEADGDDAPAPGGKRGRGPRYGF